jgi:catechol 2,3-dioxygenase
MEVHAGCSLVISVYISTRVDASVPRPACPENLFRRGQDGCIFYRIYWIQVVEEEDMRRPVISEVGHVELRVKDVDAAVLQDKQLFGLRVTDDDGQRVSLTHGTPHHCVQYVRSDEDALDHVGFVAADEEALAEVRERVDRAGWEVVSEVPLCDHIAEGFAFAGPEGFVFEIYRGMATVECEPPTTGVRPKRFGHVNIVPADTAAMMAMFEQILDFRVSDYAGPGAFMRCNVDHHGVGIFPGTGGLHHYAWEVQDLGRLAELADLVDTLGSEVLWGPGRHGIGRNLATYVLAPSGVIVECYADMDQVHNEETHVPGRWDLVGHKWFSLWSPGVPAGFVERGIPLARRRATTPST